MSTESTAEIIDSPWLQIGRIATAHGLQGDLKVLLDTDFPERFTQLKTVYAGDDRCPMDITHAKVQGLHCIIRFKGIMDRTSAEAFRGVALYIPFSEATILPKGQYYHGQIIGLTVWTIQDQLLGTVSSIFNTGSNDIYVVQGVSREILIPAIHDVIKCIDLESGRIIIDPIEGLL